jgi:RNA recognition motif-containing protein
MCLKNDKKNLTKCKKKFSSKFSNWTGNNNSDGRTIFIGGLSNDTTDAILRSYFEKFGDVEEVIHNQFNLIRFNNFRR